ncbi:MAG TPA: omptin family outer membrane protease, partial [Candidatus Omnitrophota bacterium]|nr:omptin family outer membrane protease [Candidatus Omnitrophota bacterium]
MKTKFLLIFLFISLPFNSAMAQDSWDFKALSKYFFASYTTYQFGDPSIGGDKPLSRLDFPINNLWLGTGIRRNFSKYSIGGHLLSSAMYNTRGRMKDSDWTDPSNQDFRTVFSKSANRMDYGFMAGLDADFDISDKVDLPKGLDLRPLIGFEMQRLSFVAHDGLQ